MRRLRHSLLIFSLVLQFATMAISKPVIVAPKELVRAVNSSKPDVIRECVSKLYPDSKIPSDSDIILFASDVNVFTLLLELGAPLETVDQSGLNALMVYSQGGYVELIKLLLDKGFSVNAKDYYGRSPLYYAAGNVKPDVADLLLKAGAYIDNQTSEGRTALMEAIENGCPDVVRRLIEATPNLHLQDGGGQTAIDYLKKEKWSGVSQEEWDEINKIVLEARARENP